MNSLDKQYQDLLQDILDNGVKKETRNGGTKSIFGYTIRHNMSEGFPVLTTKKMAWKTMVTELLWFLRGDSDIRFLWENNCTIWDGDWEKHYKTTCSKPYTLEEVKQKVKDGNHNFHDSMFDMGPIYGKQWRQWSAGSLEDKHGFGKIDQITNLINDLKTNPDSRRLMVSAWNPADLEASVLPPCHYGFQVYTRELSLEERRSLVSQEVFNKIYNGGGPDTLSHSEINQWNIPTRAISLMYNCRSQDVPLGTPFNLASYGLLLIILAKEVNMVPEELISNMGDCHIYLNQIDGVKEQLTREPFELPTLSMDYREGEYDKDLKGFVPDDFVLFNYQSHPSIKIPLSN